MWPRTAAWRSCRCAGLQWYSWVAGAAVGLYVIPVHDAGSASRPASSSCNRPFNLAYKLHGCSAVASPPSPPTQAALAGVPVGLLIANAGILGVDSLAQLDIAAIRSQVGIVRQAGVKPASRGNECLWVAMHGAVCMQPCRAGRRNSTWRLQRHASCPPRPTHPPAAV